MRHLIDCWYIIEMNFRGRSIAGDSKDSPAFSINFE